MELRPDSLFFISGPMRGKQDIKAMNATAKYLKDHLGCVVVNPQELTVDRSSSDYNNVCAECIAVSDAVILMDGWSEDPESLKQFVIAIKLGVDVIFRCQLPMVINNIFLQEDFLHEHQI